MTLNPTETTRPFLCPWHSSRASFDTFDLWYDVSNTPPETPDPPDSLNISRFFCRQSMHLVISSEACSEYRDHKGNYTSRSSWFSHGASFTNCRLLNNNFSHCNSNPLNQATDGCCLVVYWYLLTSCNTILDWGTSLRDYDFITFFDVLAAPRFFFEVETFLTTRPS